MIIWIHISELKNTIIIGDTTYAPSDDPNDCQPMPEELMTHLGIASQSASTPLADDTPGNIAPLVIKKG